MRTLFFPRRGPFVIAMLIATASVGSDTSLAAQTPLTADSWILTTPKRRARDAPPAMPPDLPLSARTVTPSTIHIVVRREAAGHKPTSRRQTVSRTADRVHFRDGEAREWLFERNSVDPRRASAMLVDHSVRAIVLYEETDLRMTLGIRGWADVLTFGFASDTLGLYTRTNETRIVAGVRFTRFTAPRGRAGDVWWSDQESLPSTFTIAEGDAVTRYAIGSLEKGVDETLLRPATTRFPSYRVLDLSDWLERH